MSDIKISLDSSGPDSDISIVRVDGVIDTVTSLDLGKVMTSLMERRRYKIVIDLGGVDYISSAGWGIFISNIREIKQNAGDIKLARMIPNVYEIFELLEFDRILKAFDSVEKARIDFDGVRKGTSEREEFPSFIESSQRSSSGDGKAQAPAPQSTHQAAPSIEPPTEIKEPPAPKPAEIILEMISKDPFLSISEIRREISKKNPGLRLGWWKIWGILRRENLLSKKNRFRRIRQKAGGE